jgi:hypothetical protein
MTATGHFLVTDYQTFHGDKRHGFNNLKEGKKKCAAQSFLPQGLRRAWI